MKNIFRIIGGIVVIGVIAWWYAGRSSGPIALPADNPKIILDAPLPGDVVTSPLIVRGKARGTWYFEASFPVILTDWDGKIIAQVPAQAQSDWMTTDWVPFEATLTFDLPSYGKRGTLIFRKDNPSGLPEHDDAVEILVEFP